MFVFWQKLTSWARTTKVDPMERDEVEKARKYLEKIHPQSKLREKEEFRFLKTSQKGKYTRYHFQKGTDDTITYVVLSEEERSKIIQSFQEQKGEGYAYYDSAILGRGNVAIQHRFYQPEKHDTSLTYMTDHGEVWGRNFEMDPDD